VPSTEMTVQRAERVELVGPTPNAGDCWGDENNTLCGNNPYGFLPNRSIFAVDSNDDAAASNAGAVHIFSNIGQLLYTFSGNSAGDYFGSGGVVVLNDQLMAIRSPKDVVNSNADAGSVTIVNFVTGVEVFRVSGEDASDQFGLVAPEFAQPDRIVIVTPTDNVGGFSSAGSVKVYKTDGSLIANITGLSNADQVGNFSIASNGSDRLLIVSTLEDNGAVADAGSVRLVNSISGAVLLTLRGDTADDKMGSQNAHFLPNGNIVILSRSDDVGGVVDAGSVMLLDKQGATIATFQGNDASDQWGYYPQLKFNQYSNFIVSAPTDDNSTLSNNGLMMVINGTTGAILSTFTGESASDSLSNDDKGGVLANGNFAIRTTAYNFNGVSNTGMVMLINGLTGALIQRHGGDVASDQWALYPGTSNPSSNFMFRAVFDDVGSFTNAGSYVLLNGTTGDLISVFSGLHSSEALGTTPSLLLSNGNFVLRSLNYDIGATLNVGRSYLVNGETGAVMGGNCVGTTAADAFGSAFALQNGGYACFSNTFDANGIVDSGRVQFVGADGSMLQNYSGIESGEGLSKLVNVSADLVLLQSPLRTGSGPASSGWLQLVNTATGAPIKEWTGLSSGDKIGYDSALIASDGKSILVQGSPQASRQSLVNMGVLTLFPLE